MFEIKSHKNDSTKNPPPTSLLSELNKYLEYAGLYNPLHKIYVIEKGTHHYAVLLFILVISYLPKLQYCKNVTGLLAKKLSDGLDGNPLIIGIVTILKQLHVNVQTFFVDLVAQYTLSYVNLNLR